MQILSVYDEAFRPYGRVVEGYPVEGILKALAETPCTDAVVYEPRIEALHQAENAEAIGEALARVIDFRPAAIIERFDLRRPIYCALAAYGHMGREDLDIPWEKTDLADTLRSKLL